MIEEGNFPGEPSACNTIEGLFVSIKFYNLWSKVNISGMKNSCAKTMGMGSKTHTRGFCLFIVAL